MVLRDDSEKRLLDAMAMEKEYRKLQTAGTEAKAAFRYHEKLAGFGFADTVEYERAKVEHYLRTANIKVKNIASSQMEDEVKKAILAEQEVLLIAIPEKTSVYTGVETEVDSLYCKSKKVPVLSIGYDGCCDVVTTSDDVAFALVSKQKGMGLHLSERLANSISEEGLKCDELGGIIAYNSKKFSGFAKREVGSFIVYYWYISFRVEKDVENYFLIEKVSPLVGLSDVSSITRQSLIEKVVSWLR